MPQAHGDRLSATDASFLAQEGPDAHMHIGGVIVFEGPPPAYTDLLVHVRGRLHLVPRYRQRLHGGRLETGRPVWVDDGGFHLEYHVRHSALPAPGNDDQLRALAARIFSQRMDRTKPLWELWLVENFESDGFALISKTHHALVDGVSGVDLATVLLDVSPEPHVAEHPDGAWEAGVAPSRVDLLARGAREVATLPLRLLGRAAGVAGRPVEAVAGALEAAEGLGEVVWAGLNPAPQTPLNVPIGPHRRLEVVHCELEDFKRVKDAFGTTVNDVVLAVVAGALRRWLRGRGVRTQGMELRALVPVSVRGRDERGELGNRIAVMRGPLPVYVDDPVARLQVVKQAMDGLKESKQALGAEVLTAAQAFAPPTVLAQASRLQFSTRLFNLLVTNVPGPQFPLYLMGRRMTDLVPIAFLPADHALAAAIVSYDGGMTFGLLGDYDVMDDLDELAAAVRAALTELLDAAAAQAA